MVGYGPEGRHESGFGLHFENHGEVLPGSNCYCRKILGKESMGGGDIKMLFMTTLYLGIWNGLFALILSCVIGLLFIAFCKQKKIPFGPSIAIATYLGLTIGPFFTRWYLSML